VNHLTKKVERLDHIFDYISDLLFLITKDTKVLDCRGREESFLIPKEEIYGKKLSEILPEGLGKNVLELTQITLERKNPQIYEYMLPIENEERHFEARFIYFSEDEIAIFIRDITIRKIAEIKLKESEENLRRTNKELEQILTEKSKKIKELEKKC